MKTLISVIIILILNSINTKIEVSTDKTEAQKAYRMLNDIRINTSKYYTELPFLRNSKIKRSNLVWNDTLAKVAESKALDMATRNYFNHVDPDGYGINHFIMESGYKLEPEWVSNSDLNFFESIAGTVDGGEDAIKTLLIDKGVPSLGHRKHLLGIGEWESTLIDIGIGYAKRDSANQSDSFVCLIIAKHKW